ncbi:MAG: response regulator transcription factor [Deltaproteobacteria bacterium]|nr:response regulator transcription factor [Deltaproteobacteria bacterium]
MSPPFLFLVVEDDTALARTLARYLSQFGAVEVAPSIAAADAAMPRLHGMTGLLVDVGLGDGSGLDWLRRVRAAGVRVPALVLTANRGTEVIAEAQLSDAYYLPKPPRQANLLAFVERSRRERTRLHDQLLEDVRAFSQKHALSPREEEALRLAASGVQRHELADALGVEETTTKTIVRNLLRKVHKNALADAVSEIHRNVFGERTG